MSKNLNEKQILAAQKLAAGQRARMVAKELGVTPETISRWRMKDYNFIAYINEIQAETHEDARTALRALQGVAIEAIRSLLESEDTAPRVRLQASLSVLRMSDVMEHPDFAIGPDDPKTAKANYVAREYGYQKSLMGEG